MTDQESLKDQILITLDSTAEWREGKASEYPDDERNAEAVKELRLLYNEIEKIPAADPLFNTLQEEFDRAADLFGFCEGESELNRAIGFHRSFTTGREYLAELIELAQTTIEPEPKT